MGVNRTLLSSVFGDLGTEKQPSCTVVPMCIFMMRFVALPAISSRVGEKIGITARIASLFEQNESSVLLVVTLLSGWREGNISFFIVSAKFV